MSDKLYLESVTSLSTQQVLVSIVITHFNYSDYVRAAILSVVVQTHTNWECVIVDDGSTTNHLEALRKIVAEIDHHNIRILALPENLGQTNAVFAGLESTLGEFVATLDPDDVYEPNFIEKMLRCHLNPQIYAAVAACEMGLFRVGGGMLTGNYVGFKDRAITEQKLPTYEASAFDYGFSKYYPPEQTGWIWATTSSLMFRRNALDKLRRDTYMAFTKVCADTYCLYGAHMLGGTLFLDERLSWRGIHSRNAAETSAIFSQGQRRHHAAFEDTSDDVKFFVAKQIVQYADLTDLEAGTLLRTLKSHFLPDQLFELLEASEALQKLLVQNYTGLSTLDFRKKTTFNLM